MDPRFTILTNQLEQKFRALMSSLPVAAEDVPSSTPTGGVYLFFENDVPLYAGRTKRPIAKRIRGHFSTAKDCPFAWQLAREQTGKTATYKKVGSRKHLLEDSSFCGVYKAAKDRIRKMQVRYVEERDPVRQALLEVYTAIVSGSKYNDFDTH